MTCICGHSRGTLTKPVGFKFQYGAVVSTVIAILPELRSLGLDLVGRSLYDVEGFSQEIPRIWIAHPHSKESPTSVCYLNDIVYLAC